MSPFWLDLHPFFSSPLPSVTICFFTTQPQILGRPAANQMLLYSYLLLITNHFFFTFSLSSMTLHRFAGFSSLLSIDLFSSSLWWTVELFPFIFPPHTFFLSGFRHGSTRPPFFFSSNFLNNKHLPYPTLTPQNIWSHFCVFANFLVLHLSPY